MLKTKKLPVWKDIEMKGCTGVLGRQLLSNETIQVVQLLFGKNATIHEHSAEWDIDVVCLEGAGFVSVGDDFVPLEEDQRVHWPAGELHQLWTEDHEMVTLMIEHKKAGESAEPVWESVDSSMISAFKYNPASQELDVRFKRTGLYRYFEVPSNVVKELREADSVGSFMRYDIIGIYGHQKIRR